MEVQPIKGWEDYYEITPDLKVRNKLTGNFVQPYSNDVGYMVLTLSNKDHERKLIYVHRLVAEAFIPNPENKPCINHINNDKSDYSISNLEWCTYKENSMHMVRCGRQARSGLGKYYGSKLTLDLRTGIYYDSMREATEARGLNRGSVVARISNGDYRHDLMYVK